MYKWVDCAQTRLGSSADLVCKTTGCDFFLCINKAQVVTRGGQKRFANVVPDDTKRRISMTGGGWEETGGAENFHGRRCTTEIAVGWRCDGDSAQRRNRRDKDSPGKLGNIQQDDVDPFSSQSGGGIASTGPATDDKGLGVLQH